MGDCRLRIQVSKALFEGASDTEDAFYTITVVCSADTTVREMIEARHDDNFLSTRVPPFSIFKLIESHKAKLWDCTVHPPKDISDLAETDKQGLTSKTLYDAGFYPSGSLQVLPVCETPKFATTAKLEDAQYNRITAVQESSDSPSSLRVQLAGTHPNEERPLPSQVFESVTKRFSEEDEEQAQVAATARRERQKNKEESKRKEQERNRKLEDRIRQLETSSSSKNKKVSDQVKRMLIKSRATGRSNLKMQDRVYFRCIIDDDGGSTREEYRFFSRQDTVGRILSSFSVQDRETELLVRRQSQNANEGSLYRRLPVLLRVYEAISMKYISDFDKIVIRVFDPTTEEATTSVDEECVSVRISNDNTQISDTEQQVESDTEQQVDRKVGINGAEGATTTTTVENARLFSAIRSLDGKNKSSKTRKKATAAANKVRQMQMKSKAKGDAKRVKMEERFFLELVIVVDDGKADDCDVTLAPVFVARSDNFERLVRDCSNGKGDSLSSYEFLVPYGEESFQRIADTGMSLSEAERQNIVHCYERLILRFF